MSEITKNDIFNAGLALRREVLGDEYVDRAFAVKDEFSEDVQNYITTHAWGAVWARRGDDGELTLPKKTRSIMNLGRMNSRFTFAERSTMALPKKKCWRFSCMSQPMPERRR
jgi:hypothetical protein